MVRIVLVRYTFWQSEWFVKFNVILDLLPLVTYVLLLKYQRHKKKKNFNEKIKNR